MTTEKDLRRQEPRAPNDLDHEELAKIVRSVQAILWLDGDDEGEYWDNDKPWDVEQIEYVADILERHELRPHLGWNDLP